VKSPNPILRTNLFILLGTALLIALLMQRVPNPIGFVIFFAAAYVSQALINLLLGFQHWGNGAPYFLSALLVLLIGFGACAGMFGVAVR